MDRFSEYRRACPQAVFECYGQDEANNYDPKRILRFLSALFESE